MVTIGYSALGVSLPLFVAHRTGLFADRDLNVRMKGYPTAHPLVEGIVDGDVPCGGFVAFPIALHRHVRARAGDADRALVRLLRFAVFNLYVDAGTPKPWARGPEAEISESDGGGNRGVSDESADIGALPAVFEKAVDRVRKIFLLVENAAKEPHVVLVARD